MNSKEISRAADRIFQGMIPPSWVLRDQQDQEDHGVDYEIELMSPEGKATGFIFKVQQKGQQASSRLADGHAISYSLETDKTRYYLKQLRIPIVFVVVEVSTRSAWWLPLHGNHDVAERLAAAESESGESLTLHLPAGNVLPGTVNQLIREVARMMDVLTVERLKEMDVPDLAEAFANERDLDGAERSLRMAGAVLRSERTQRLINEAKLHEAFEINRRAFIDEGETVEGRFHAGVQAVRIATGLTAAEQMSRDDLIRFRLEICRRLVGLTRRLPVANYLRHYGLFLARSARLRAFVEHDAALVMAREAQASDLDELARIVVEDAFRKSRDRIVLELRRAQRRIVTMLSLSMYGAVIYAWNELIEAVTIFFASLRCEEKGDAAAAIRVWLDSVGLVCRTVAESSGDDEVMAFCALNHVRIGLDSGDVGDRIEVARTLIEKIRNEEWRTTAVNLLGKLIAFGTNLSAPDNERSIDDLTEGEREELFRKLAEAVGIDVDDPTDPSADAVRVGIKDFDFGRVVRDCEHLFVSIDANGVPARLIGLPTAGFKSVRCLKHGQRTGALELDAAYSSFRTRHCDGCPDRTPRSADWKWSNKWQMAEDERVLGKADSAGDAAGRRNANGAPMDSAPRHVAPVAASAPNDARTAMSQATRQAKRDDEEARRAKRKREREARKRQRGR